jgi:hypothetical protein
MNEANGGGSGTTEAMADAGHEGGGQGGAPAMLPLGSVQRAHHDAPTAEQQQRMPTSEEEADAMLYAQLQGDPEKMRRAAREFAAKMESLAARATAEREKNSLPTPPTTSAQPTVVGPVGSTIGLIDGTPAPLAIDQASTAAVVATPPAAPTTPGPAAAPSTPIPAVATAPTTPARLVPPTGYLPVPEGLYQWTPADCGGRALHCVPDRVIERTGKSTLIIAILVSPAFARNRAGRVVSLPEGARVVIHAGIAWAPMIDLAKGPTGRPVLWAAPTLDSNGRQVVYQTGDWGVEYGMDIEFDPDPKDPSRARLIDLETIRGTRGG